MSDKEIEEENGGGESALEQPEHRGNPLIPHCPRCQTRMWRVLEEFYCPKCDGLSPGTPGDIRQHPRNDRRWQIPG